MKLVQRIIQEEVLTYDPQNGEPPLHIRAGMLREYLREFVPDRLAVLHFPEQSLEELIVKHGLEEARLKSMTEAEAKEPVIVGLLEDGMNFLIDGGHRRYYWAKRGQHILNGWLVPTIVWRAFSFDPNGPNVIGHFPDGSLLNQRRSK